MCRMIFGHEKKSLTPEGESLFPSSVHGLLLELHPTEARRDCASCRSCPLAAERRSLFSICLSDADRYPRSFFFLCVSVCVWCVAESRTECLHVGDPRQEALHRTALVARRPHGARGKLCIPGGRVGLYDGRGRARLRVRGGRRARTATLGSDLRHGRAQ